PPAQARIHADASIEPKLVPIRPLRGRAARIRRVHDHLGLRPSPGPEQPRAPIERDVIVDEGITIAADSHGERVRPARLRGREDSRALALGLQPAGVIAARDPNRPRVAEETGVRELPSDFAGRVPAKPRESRVRELPGVAADPDLHERAALA